MQEVKFTVSTACTIIVSPETGTMTPAEWTTAVLFSVNCSQKNDNTRDHWNLPNGELAWTLVQNILLRNNQQNTLTQLSRCSWTEWFCFCLFHQQINYQQCATMPPRTGTLHCFKHGANVLHNLCSWSFYIMFYTMCHCVTSCFTPCTIVTSHFTPCHCFTLCFTPCACVLHYVLHQVPLFYIFYTMCHSFTLCLHHVSLFYTVLYTVCHNVCKHSAIGTISKEIPGHICCKKTKQKAHKNCKWNMPQRITILIHCMDCPGEME